MATRKSLKAASTHFGNLEKRAPEKSSQEMENNQEAAVLIAPEVRTKGFSTHTTTASRRKVQALSISDLPNDEDPTATGNEIDRDIRPAIMDDFDDLDDVLEDPEDLELENSGEQSTILSDAEEEDVDLDDDDEDEDLDIEDEEDEDDVDTDLQVEGDTMDIVDVDNMPEEVEDDEVKLAVLESSVLALRGNRVIASMTTAQAAEEGIEDEFMSDEFSSVVASTCASKGLRKGLAELGFVMASVNLGAAHVVAAQVNQRVKQATAKVTASNKDNEKHLRECLALAAVGINKGFWKDVQHPLKAAVEATLLHAGVQNPKSTTAKLFAANGVAFAHAMVTVASRLVDMPASTRSVLADALDFTNDSIEEDIEEVEGEAVDVDVDEDAVDFMDVEGASIEAALSKPGRHRTTAALLTPKAPITARAILGGSDILEF